MHLAPFLLAACAGSRPPEVAGPEPAPAPEPAQPPTLAFEPLALDEAMERAVTPTVTSRAVLDGAPVEVGLAVLGRSGTDGFGLLRRRDGTLLGESCHDQDFDSLLWAFERPFLVSHFECVPGEVYVTPLQQDASGALSPRGRVPVDWSAAGGVWFPCSGQASAWGTHLGSEEYEPDAKALKDGALDPDPFGSWASMMRYWPDPTRVSPYLYGYITEIALTSAEGASSAVKHGAMGRFSHEIAFVVSDDRTAYLSDDGRGVGWFMFVADAPRDLTAGTLYAARLSAAAESDGRFDVSWVPLGHATDADVRGWIDAGVQFSDLFEVAAPQGTTCPGGFTWTRHAYGTECLKLAPPSPRVPDPARAASRLETRRYAALRGATTELEKGEGVTWDPETGTVYVSISNIAGRMLAEQDAPTDHIALAPNPCGAVYAGPTSSGAADSEGTPILSRHVMTSLAPALVGRPLPEADAGGDSCETDGIANPDNLTFLPGFGLLMVAEDTNRHHVNVLWAHDTRTGSLTRVLAAPRGGEVTGIHWIPDLGGWGYLTVAVQHPWGELPKGDTAPDFVTEDDKRSFTAVLGPFPSLAR